MMDRGYERGEPAVSKQIEEKKQGKIIDHVFPPRYKNNAPTW